ncbi:MAG TPA: hypothetical protein VLD67_16325, partial [Vicinamibacterales bacterium]|nr:hypothetical protein [Vicinamibacterales bacterium]
MIAADHRAPERASPGVPPPSTGLGRFAANLRAVPHVLRETAFRTGGFPATDRTRSTFVFGNVFLHLHAV